GIVVAFGMMGAACSGGSSETPAQPQQQQASSEQQAPAEPTPPPTTPSATAERRTGEPHGLLVASSQFRVENGTVTATPGPARLEILTRDGDTWRTELIEDPDSNVFHKALWWQPPNGEPGIITLGGMAASVKLWRRGESGWTSETIWTESFGGRFD